MLKELREYLKNNAEIENDDSKSHFPNITYFCELKTEIPEIEAIINAKKARIKNVDAHVEKVKYNEVFYYRINIYGSWLYGWNN